MECYQNILIILIVSLATSKGSEGETTTTTSDNDAQVIVYKNDSQLDRLFFQQEIPNEFQPIIPSLITELNNLTDEQFLQFLKKATERAKQSYDELKTIHDQLEKNLTSDQAPQRLKRCHACHKKRMKFIDPVPVFVPVPVPVHIPKRGGGCSGGCGGGYVHPAPQTCHSCGGGGGYGGGGYGGGGYGGGGYGGGGYGGGYGGSAASASASASASSGSWGKK